MPDLRVDRRRAAWQFVAVALRVLLAAVFAFAAVMKLEDLGAFAREIRGYQVIPDQWSSAVANVIPWLELVVAAFLVLPLWRLEARVMLLAMLVGFTVLKVSAELRGLKIECGCFGHDNLLSKVLSGWAGVALNIGLMALLGVEAYGARRPGRRAPEGPPKTPRGTTRTA